MKILFTLLVFFILTNAVLAQDNCTENSVILDNGIWNYKVGHSGYIKQFSFESNSQLSYTENSFKPNFYYSGFSTGFKSGVWFEGKDENGNLREARNEYSSGAAYDYRPGLLDSMGEPVFEDGCNPFIEIRKVRKVDIEQLLVKINDPSGLDVADVPDDILLWPAIGNEHFEEEYGYKIERELAPFFDTNMDGKYEPLDGDYPIPLTEFPSFIPFHFTFHTYHDVTEHVLTNTQPLHVEVKQISYQINCDEAKDLGNATFTRLVIDQRGPVITDLKTKLFIDNDLGCYLTDLCGFSPSTNSTYSYNKDGFDQDDCPNDIQSIGSSSTVVQAHVFFSPLDRYRLVNSLAVGPPFPAWPDSVSYIYTDYPNIENGWSLQNDTNIVNFDIRSINTFNIEDSHKVLDFAEYILFDSTTIGLDIFNSYDERINSFVDEYNAALEDSGLCTQIQEPCQESCVWPGDINDDGVVTFDDYVLLNLFFQDDLDRTGTSRNPSVSEWYGWHSEDWDMQFKNINSKYFDVNGDGIINIYDERKLLFNHANVHERQYPHDPAFPDPEGISISFDKDEISNEGFIFEKVVKCQITLGEIGVPLSNNIKALSFDIPKLEKVNVNGPLGANVAGGELNDFVEANSYYIFSAEDPDRMPVLDVERAAIIFRDTTLQVGSELFSIPFDILPIAEESTLGTTTNLDGRDTVNVVLENIVAYDANNNPVPLGVKSIQPLYLTDLEVVDIISVNETPFYYDLYPNPTNDNLYLSYSNNTELSFTIIDQLGIKVLSGLISNGKEVNVSSLRNGIYFINMSDGEHSVTKKFIKL